MVSPYCPDCGGSGFVIKYFFALDCPLCKANKLGNKYLPVDDLKNPAYVKSQAIIESSPVYWGWLKFMITHDHIRPNGPNRRRSAKKTVE